MARRSRIEPTILPRTERRRIQETRLPVEPEVAFNITKTRHGRVHGYFVESIFYIVWLDPKHELYL